MIVCSLQARSRLLATFVIHHGPHTEALHVALHTLCDNLSGRMVHQYRFCPWTVLRPWTATLTTDIHDWIRIIVGLPMSGPHPLLALLAPIAQGGLGIPHPQQEAALHHLQVIWPTVEELAPAELERSPSFRGALEALAFFNRIVTLISEPPLRTPAPTGEDYLPPCQPSQISPRSIPWIAHLYPRIAMQG